MFTDLTANIKSFINDLEPGSYAPGAVDYLKEQAFSKFLDPSEGSEDAREAATYEKYMGYNTYVRNLNKVGFQLSPAEELTFRYWLAHMLPEFNLPEILLRTRFSGGATSTRRRTEGHPYLKCDMTKPFACTPHALKYVSQALYNTRLQGLLENIQLTRGGVYFEVAKNAEIKRSCDKVPDGNTFVAHGGSSLIRDHLNSVFGIDLNFGHHSNAYYARLGSVYGSYATIDGKNGSGLQAMELLNYLPIEWCEFFMNIRTEEIYIKNKTLNVDRWVQVEEIASMGHALTFELETVIFLAACYTVRDMYESRYGKLRHRTIKVYGDDITLPTELVEPYKEFVSKLGWIINEDKSFADGPFRESCGSHWYNGRSIKPFYIREPVDNLNTLLLFMNNLRAWQLHDDGQMCPHIADFWLYLKRAHIPKELWGGDDIHSSTSLFSLPHCKGKRLALKRRPKKDRKFRGEQRLTYRLMTPRDESYAENAHRDRYSVYRMLEARDNCTHPRNVELFGRGLDTFVSNYRTNGREPTCSILAYDPMIQIKVDRPQSKVGNKSTSYAHFEMHLTTTG